MSKITIEHNPSEERLKELGVASWEIWEKESSCGNDFCVSDARRRHAGYFFFLGFSSAQYLGGAGPGRPASWLRSLGWVEGVRAELRWRARAATGLHRPRERLLSTPRLRCPAARRPAASKSAASKQLRRARGLQRSTAGGCTAQRGSAQCGEPPAAGLAAQAVPGAQGRTTAALKASL